MAAILVYRLEDERVPPALASLRRGYRKIQTSVNRKSLKKHLFVGSPQLPTRMVKKLIQPRGI